MRSIRQTEENYLLLTCSKQTESLYDIYIDDQLPQMFAHHFIQLKDDYPLAELYSLLTRVPGMLKRRYVHVKSSCGVDIPFSMKKALFDLGYILDEELFYSIDLSEWTGQQRFGSAKWGTAESLHDGCHVMQAYDSLYINEAFAKEKLRRKYPFYEKGIIQLFVCYSDEGEPVGCAELYVDHREKISKIEEVAVLEPYQRKGYGTKLLREMLAASKRAGMKSSYLVTSGSDKAKWFYEKLGFQKEYHLTTIFKYLFSPM
ncbi:GNAT family N-acetyltransferase [Bacillus sonorensis]|uniref:Spore outer layer maturation N-acetyltransferase CgeE n=2 Tax=Bacillus sonorensis TaxID=119858 RepID=M5PFK9_9BACI|nr:MULTISPECIES: GNAT family N-acetyltransferase [Bacillus]TWK82451.1 Amino-acid acetyltransferase [Bacillus paralicheniformis]ASB88812.1 putative N-acetyltransferase CgeE [Bacillus sonorensis]EME76380.1 spore outer layer maturation N-acetyltransferase CgeE [Bacillus sonorensis L12]MBG9915392.1 acetyltransferase [Bacillus sonorensis]MCF7618165.1 GNAT family N-acetyltransferase [Bacillus sonorensis]